MNRPTLFLFAMPLCAATFLAAQINAPKAGIVRYPDGTVHTVYGLPANYIVDNQVLATADAASFSDLGGLTAKDGRIFLFDAAFKTVAQYESGETAPLLNIDGDLKSAVAWLPSHHSLLHWNGASFLLTEVNGAGVLGAVSSVRLATAKSATLLTTSAGGNVSEATVSLDSGELTSLNLLPGIHGPAFRQQSFVVSSDRDGLTINSLSAILHTVPLSASGLVFERSSSHSFHVMSPAAKQNWILDLGDSGTPNLFQLPEAPAHFAATTLQGAKQ